MNDILTPLETASPSYRSHFRIKVSITLILIGLLVCGWLTVNTLLLPSPNFPVEKPVVIEPGATLGDIAVILAREGVIRSEALFKALAVYRGTSETLHAGTYSFPQPLSTADVLTALSLGDYADASVSITIPEGTRVTNIPAFITPSVPTFDVPGFLERATPLEGYLFPDTYHITPAMTPDELVLLMRSTLDAKIRDELGRDPNTVTNEDIILASILEREGNAPENMALIAGILKNRLEIDMPLQVDATLEYERGLGSAELSIEDLETDSPYNTYTRRGYPPTPIANPGIVALRAALEPTPSNYLYYLTGNDGEFYYAHTFDEHKLNKARYLR